MSAGVMSSAGIMSDRAACLKAGLQLPFPGSVRTAIRRFACGSRGGAAIELALGAVMLTATTVMCFDIYSRITSDTALGRMATTMSDYVSLEAAPEKAQMLELGEFLRDHELGIPADLVYVITAIRQPPGNPLPASEVLWKHDEIRFGNPVETAALADGCARYADPANVVTLPTGFTMRENEVVIVTEVCARPTAQGSLTDTFVGSDMYRIHALPFRDPSPQPAAPV